MASSSSSASGAGGGAGAGAGDSSAAGSAVSKNEWSSVRDVAVDWAACNGLLMGAPGIKAGQPARYHHVPFTLAPLPYPRTAFEQAQAAMAPFAKMVDAISRDHDWLCKQLESTGAADLFTGRLLAIFKMVHKEGITQPLALGLLRSDYMLDEKTNRLLQVELNTISSSFGALSEKVSELHQFLVRRFSGKGPAPLCLAGGVKAAKSYDLEDEMPFNDACRQLAAGIAQAHELYDAPEAVVVFVIQEGERNSCDQRMLEFELLKESNIHVVRASFKQLAKAELHPTTKALVLPSGEEVSVLYFRAGYTPNDYPDDSDWDTRLMLERSLAIKCPSIGYHLTGTKKVQQVLARDGEVERFLPDAAEAAAVRATFAGLWPLDQKDNVERARAAPEQYVLKPQREGGGNNYYGKDVKTKIDAMKPEELSGYILMERINPKLQPVAMVRDGAIVTGEGLVELGIFGTYLGDGTRCYRNVKAGHLMRSKLMGTDEGGVATGYAVLDSPFLMD